MINRLMVRIKVLQVLYNYNMVPSMTLPGAIGTLRQSLDHAYRIYYSLCGLPLELSHIALLRLEREEQKFDRNEEVIELLRKFCRNPLVEAMRADEAFVAEQQDGWMSERREVREYLTTALMQAIDYLLSGVPIEGDWDSISGVQKIWRELHRNEVFLNDRLAELIEESSTYVNDEVQIIYTFVDKTIRRCSATKPYSEVVRPQYNSESDEDFGPLLLERAILNQEEYREWLSRYFVGWDKDRVSEMDYIIMQVAVAEALAFPNIPTTVTINEYVDLAHYYSSVNGHVFINGILHQLFKQLKDEGKILGA